MKGWIHGIWFMGMLLAACQTYEAPPKDIPLFPFVGQYLPTNDFRIKSIRYQPPYLMLLMENFGVEIFRVDDEPFNTNAPSQWITNAYSNSDVPIRDAQFFRYRGYLLLVTSFALPGYGSGLSVHLWHGVNEPLEVLGYVHNPQESSVNQIQPYIQRGHVHIFAVDPHKGLEDFSFSLREESAGKLRISRIRRKTLVLLEGARAVQISKRILYFATEKGDIYRFRLGINSSIHPLSTWHLKHVSLNSMAIIPQLLLDYLVTADGMLGINVFYMPYWVVSFVPPKPLSVYNSAGSISRLRPYAEGFLASSGQTGMQYFSIDDDHYPLLQGETPFFPGLISDVVVVNGQYLLAAGNAGVLIYDTNSIVTNATNQSLPPGYTSNIFLRETNVVEPPDSKLVEFDPETGRPIITMPNAESNTNAVSDSADP